MFIPHSQRIFLAVMYYVYVSRDRIRASYHISCKTWPSWWHLGQFHGKCRWIRSEVEVNCLSATVKIWHFDYHFVEVESARSEQQESHTSFCHYRILVSHQTSQIIHLSNRLHKVLVDLGWPSLRYSCLRQNIKGYWLLPDGDHLKRPIPMSLSSSSFWQCWGLGKSMGYLNKRQLVFCVCSLVRLFCFLEFKTLILTLLLLSWRSFALASVSEMFKILRLVHVVISKWAWWEHYFSLRKGPSSNIVAMCL